MALPFTIALWPGLVSSELLFPHLQKNEIYVKWLIWCPEYCRWPIKVHFLFSHKSELADVELLGLLGTLINRLSTTWFSQSKAKVFLIPVALSILRLPKPNLRLLCHKPNRPLATHVGLLGASEPPALFIDVIWRSSSLSNSRMWTALFTLESVVFIATVKRLYRSRNDFPFFSKLFWVSI